MNTYNNTLEPLPKPNLDKNRFRVKHCPCGKSNKDGKFVPYVGYDDKGYCHACGEKFLLELKRNDESWKFPTAMQPVKKQPEKILPASFIPVTTFKESLKHHLENNFIKYLIIIFGSEITEQLISKYFIGTSKHWNGATVFWEIDINKPAKIRTGKIMLYNAITGKRIKDKDYNPNWVHSVLNLSEFTLQQCFFGEHLLQGNNMPVAIVESEKTAIIASVYLPKFIWLAAGNKTGLTDEKCKVLQGRKVVLYPDLSKPEDKISAFELWTQKAKELSHITCFTVSDLLERKATEAEKSQGLDLADYLIKFPVSVFRSEPEKGLINQIFSKDIISYAEHPTTNEFNYLNSVYFKLQNGNGIDIFFNESGEPIKPGEQSEAVNNLANFFKKKLQPGMFDNSPCWVHTDNPFIVSNN